jgi:methionine aminopeptidase
MSLELSYYNTAASICGKVYLDIKSKILLDFIENKVEKINILPLLEYGNNRIIEETKLIFKKMDYKLKGIASPVSISLNNCVGNYTFDLFNKYNELNFIKIDDIIKINLGVSINGCIANLCETFTVNKNKEITKIIKFLDNLMYDLEEIIEPGETNDTIRMMIESKCTEKDVFPIENCKSFEQKECQIKFNDSKYLILNYTKKYDLDDNLLIEPNLCFEFDKNEVYTIDISVIPISSECYEKFTYKNINNSHLYRFNENHYSLKLKSSRDFYNNVKSKHYNYLFDAQEYLKNKFCISECIKNNILEEYPITFVTHNKKDIPVITKRFTILVTKDSCKILKYNI